MFEITILTILLGAGLLIGNLFFFLVMPLRLNVVHFEVLVAANVEQTAKMLKRFPGRGKPN